MEREENFNRRICAVLLADVTGFSALMGEDDERTATAVQLLQSIVRGIVSEANGHAESVAGDAIFATFDSVVAAVDAALSIQRRLATETFEGTQLRLRIGVHFGDVLTREGAAFGDAINVASRLEALAKPGTVCISDGVYRQVRKKFDERFVDLGQQQLKNISDPVHAYLVVPREAETEHGPSNRRTVAPWAVGAVAIVAVATLAVIAANRYRLAREPDTTAIVQESVQAQLGAPTPPGDAATPPEAAKVALGVMLFKQLGGGEEDWRLEALRDGLNTQLSQLSQVKVYSKEFLDFLVTRKGLSEIEAATQLGITKMLSGSFIAAGGTLRIETHVVDVTTGVLEAAYTTRASEEDFLNLQNQLALETIARLDLPVTEGEKKALLAQQENTTVEALRLLLESEGAGGVAAARPSGPSSRAPGAGPSRLFVFRVGAAFADDGATAEVAIRELLEHYRRAAESKEVDAIATMHANFTAEQQAAQGRYFDNVRDLQVAIDDVDVVVVGDEAVVSYTRTDDFADVRTGRPMHAAVRLTKTVRLDNGDWKFAEQ